MQQYIIYSKDLFHYIFSSFTNATIQYRVSTSITNKKVVVHEKINKKYRMFLFAASFSRNSRLKIRSIFLYLTVSL